MRSFLFFTFVLVLSSCHSDESSTQSVPEPSKTTILRGDEGNRIDSLLTPYVQELKKMTDNDAALAIGITKGDEIIYARTFGYANIEKGIEADLNTVFHIASLSKPFTAAAIAKLIQQGKLKLDDKLIDFLPEFKMKGEGYKDISIKHVLTHTSGIPANISPDDWTQPSFGEKAMEENLQAVQDHSLEFQPGTDFAYSNSAFDILGVLISRASGMSFSDYVSKEILMPAGMTQSTYKKPKDRLPDNYAASYSYGIETQDWSPYPYNEKLYPSSGVLTSILDLCRWGQIHQGKGRFQEHIVLKEDYFNLMVSPHYETPWGDNIGLSWFLQSYLDHPNIMHTGQDTGFEAIIYIYPKDNVSIAVLSNRDFSRTGRIVNAASEVIFEKELKTYQVSAKYPFADAYNQHGIEKAKSQWEELKKDSLDAYYVDDDDILSMGAILENGQEWKEAMDILEFYNSLNTESTYSWRLLGNAHLNLGDSARALSCYEHCLSINPDYEKATLAIEKMGN